MGNINFYYGMSGAFKTSTIKKELENNENIDVIWSMIKPYKKLECGIFDGLVRENHLNYAIQHLCLLEHTLYDYHENIIVERGISDMLFYYLGKKDVNNSFLVKKAVEKELDLCRNYNVHKILLIQRDEFFIEDTILNEKSRKDVFPGGLDDYIKSQESYINFTKEYNKIDEIIEIDNAEEYLKNL